MLVVAGALHWDVVVRAPRLPRQDETLRGSAVAYRFGGKGGNQALAARRLGAEVAMVACVGDEPNADLALAQLAEEGVDLSHVTRLPEESTGVAMILVDENGENQIVVAPGANARFEERHLDLPVLASIPDQNA